MGYRQGNERIGGRVPMGQVLSRIESLRSQLSKSEKKVAAIVLAQPNVIVQLSMAQIAEKAGVSEPTVLRFCRSLNLGGYQDLKMRLARELAQGANLYAHQVVSPEASFQMAPQLFDRVLSGLLRVRNALNVQQIQAVVDCLRKAERVFLVGLGEAAHLAQEGQMRWLQRGMNAVAVVDAQDQSRLSGWLKPGDAVLMLSTAKENTHLVRCLQAWQQQGVSLAAIGVDGSDLAECCPIYLKFVLEAGEGALFPSFSRLVLAILLDLVQFGLGVNPDLGRDQEGEPD